MRHFRRMYFSRAFLNDLISYAYAKGIRTQELQELSGVVGKGGTYISYREMVLILEAVEQAVGDEQLGLHMGEEMLLKGTEYVDQMMALSPSVAEAFQTAVAYSKLISDALESHLTQAAGKYTVSFTVNPNWAIQPPAAVRQVIDLTMVCTQQSLGRLLSKQYYPVAVNFPYPKPAKINEYFRLFNCPLRFDQPKPSIVFEQYLLDQPIASQNKGLLAELKRKADAELRQLTEEPDLIYQLKKAILKHKPSRITTDIVAEELHIPPRTLQRKLKALNTTFKQIEQELQLKLAKNYLETSDKGMEEISYLLGFSESSAFVRFFKNATHITPAHYRKKSYQ